MVATTRRRARARAATLTSGCEPACIEKLNDELLLHIFDILKHDSKPALLAATVVCSRWHALAQRVIDGDVGPITIGPKTADRNVKLFGRMKRDRSFRQRIIRISIKEWCLRDMNYQFPDVLPYTLMREDPYRTDGYFSRTWSDTARQKDPTWQQMQKLIDAVTTLSISTFTWSATPCMPRPLAQALARNGQCSVRILDSRLVEEYMEFSYAPFLNHWCIASLGIVSTTLTSLCVVITAADTELLLGLGRLIWTTNKLRELRIRCIGCMFYSRTIPYALSQTPFGSFTRVTDVIWLLRPSTMDSDNLLRLSTLELSNVCVCADTAIPTWVEQVDWNRLDSLTITCVTLLEKISCRAQRLTSLTLTCPSGRDCEFTTCTSAATAQYTGTLLESLTCLRHLELINSTESVTPSLLRSIGGDLRSLTVHERTPKYRPDRVRPLLSSEVFHSMKSFCTKLSCLAIDVPFSDIPYLRFIYDVASVVPTLKFLSVYRDIEVRESDIFDPPRSAVTNSTVQNDFIHLKERRQSLARFDVRLTSMPPFYLDKLRFERGNPFALLQRHLAVEPAGNSFEDGQLALQTRSIDAERAAEAVKVGASGPVVGYWESALSLHNEQAENAFDFYWKPPQPY
ncbi:uncharacterized protein RCC_10953 [Ramularia collo-cygni]|uniref:Uncharacterized protein n=1 Tax=Ramularia collo-cygni TaxID=112498 RepID=A0A2D3VPX2_9PEZI|nr:uncharacterized protein RCC_10953 [Ramularia collo-cygni]CZT25224.1 uncharacterized protein RCC_10953 [Ramularia collo-cygni]